MIKWAHKAVRIYDLNADELNAMLALEGQAGWELVGVDGRNAYFKMAIEEQRTFKKGR